MVDHPDNGEISRDGIEPQTERAILNIKAVFQAAEPPLPYDDVVSRSIYPADMKDHRNVGIA